jgi:hypothetical protein
MSFLALTDLGCGSSGRVPASKHDALSSNPSTEKKKKAFIFAL